MALTPNESGNYTISVNGEDVEVSGDDLLKMAQKGEAADRKFQEAATVKKEVEAILKTKGADLDIVNNLRKAMASQDQEALVAAVTALGMDEKQARGYLGGGEPTHKATAKQDDALNADDVEDLKWFKSFAGTARKMGVDPAQFIQGVAAERRQKGKDSLTASQRSALEKDPDMAIILRKGGKPAEDLLRVAKAILSDKFVEGEAQSLNDEAISSSSRDAMELVKRLASLGSGDGPSISLGGTPSAPLGFTGKPAATIKRPPITADTNARGAYLEQQLAEMIRTSTHPEE